MYIAAKMSLFKPYYLFKDLICDLKCYKTDMDIITTNDFESKLNINNVLNFVFFSVKIINKNSFDLAFFGAIYENPLTFFHC